MSPRLPFAGSLIQCVHRLARLQTTSEMQPKPEADVRDKALDRLIIAARRVVKLGSIVVMVLAGVAL